MKTDPADADVGKKRYCVRDVEEPDLGIREFVSSPAWTLKAHGCGDLYTAAGNEIRERVDFDEHVGEEIAVVTVDVDAWEYRIEWLVDVGPDGLADRTRRIYRKFLKGDAVDGGGTNA